METTCRIIRKGQLILLILTLLCLIGCKNERIDYSDAKNWAYFVENPEHEVDIFFIAPTSGSDKSYNMQMNDEDYKTAFCGATAMEKGIYDTEADFYAPFYRQVTLECYDLPEASREQYLTTAYKDIDDAFTYYMKHINNGRPYILAGFSQGGDMIKRLLCNNQYINEQMIAAYAIGWNFEEADLSKHPKIKMAQAEDDLGVVVSFCSEAPQYDGNNLIAPNFTYGINPLNWKTDGTVAAKEENLGACFTDYSGDILTEIPALCGAYRDESRGTLKVSDISVEQYPAVLGFLEDGNYHLYDYQFFYRNLQKNVETRIHTYLNTK